MKKTTLIFDIGKTNKKCFLFDENYQEVYKDYQRLPEIKDEDGHPADDLQAIEKWIKKQAEKLLHSKKYKITAINFSTYGATLVHLDAKGKPLTPLYNYTKPFPENILNSFHKKYGGELKIASETASPPSGMLNAGLQLYWIKKTQPAIFEKIKWSLHFPQYLSYLFTGIPLSEFTGIGCHTSLWNYQKGDYHDWVFLEKITEKLPPIVSTATSINAAYAGKKIKVGTGIHDSSAALLPYLRADQKPFLLISTGTWSISLNPFSKELLSEEDLKNDCLNYMRIDGLPVKAARLFLGKEYQVQVEKMRMFFKAKKGVHRKIKFDENIFKKIKNDFKNKIHFEFVKAQRPQPEKTDYSLFENFKEAYHQLMVELMELQVIAIKRAIGATKIKKIYIDGGFADNDIFVKLLAFYFSNKKIRTTRSPLGSALGAALIISDQEVGKQFLKKNYAMKKASVFFSV
ncbi:MAG: FGGY family carbohydrate kinase [Bacteroidota bacterium]